MSAVLTPAPFIPIARDATVVERTAAAHGVVALTLEFDGDPLPVVTAGSHIELHLRDDTVRQYSVWRAPSSRVLQIAVLHVRNGAGSRIVHDELHVGARVLVGRPRNDFPLSEAPSHVLIAGGIGITPIISMARELCSRDSDWSVHYCGASRARMALLDELDELNGNIRIYAADEGNRLNAQALLRSLAPGTAVYVCGPPRMTDEFDTLFPKHPEIRGHMERFHGSSSSPGAAREFELVLAKSGLQAKVHADQGILDALETLGVFVPHGLPTWNVRFVRVELHVRRR